jgi:hypothetical protein
VFFQFCNAQEYYPGDKSRVVIPVQLYRDLREKFYSCDTIIEIREKRIMAKDSIISTFKLSNESFKKELAVKDTTISKLSVQFDNLYKSKQQISPLKQVPVWIALVIGVVFGVLVAK